MQTPEHTHIIGNSFWLCWGFFVCLLNERNGKKKQKKKQIAHCSYFERSVTFNKQVARAILDSTKSLFAGIFSDYESCQHFSVPFPERILSWAPPRCAVGGNSSSTLHCVLVLVHVHVVCCRPEQALLATHSQNNSFESQRIKLLICAIFRNA